MYHLWWMCMYGWHFCQIYDISQDISNVNISKSVH